MKFIVFGGGGKVARHLARLATKEGHSVVPVVRNEDHVPELKSIHPSIAPAVLSLEFASVPDLTALLTSTEPDIVVFAAGSGGKGDPSRTRAVDYDGAVNIYDAMEAGNVRRLILVGAVDVRDKEGGDVPGWYDDDDKKKSDEMWGAIPKYMKAKYDAEVELHRRKSIAFTVVRPGGLTTEPAGGVTMGQTGLGKTSRELVAQTILAVAERPETEGLSIDVIDGEGSISSEVDKVIEKNLDSWIG